jgi:hypothetical protein
MAWITSASKSGQLMPSAVVLLQRLHWNARESASFAFAVHARFRRKRCAVRIILPLAPRNVDGSWQNRTPAVLSDVARTSGAVGWCGGR